MHEYVFGSKGGGDDKRLETRVKLKCTALDPYSAHLGTTGLLFYSALNQRGRYNVLLAAIQLLHRLSKSGTFFNYQKSLRALGRTVSGNIVYMRDFAGMD